MVDTMQYTEEVKQSIQIAQSIAREYQNAQFSPAHLLKAILHNEIGLASYLGALGIDIHYLRDWADVRIENEPKSAKVSESPTGDTKVHLVMETAEIVRLKLSESMLTPLCLLIAMSKPNIAFTKDQLKTFPIVEKDLIQAKLENEALEEALQPTSPNANGQGNSTKKATTSTKALYQFCIDKTNLAREGKIDPIIGRDSEIRTIAEILGRRTKPNVIVVGEPGVGKTALIDGFALNIVEQQVPSHLQSATIFELDVGSLIAGASYKGEVEDRLKKIIKEIKQFERAILFIDEIHTLMDKMGGAAGAANLLKPELARGELTVLGATTVEEYREYIEADEAFSRRFEVVKVEEPDVKTTVKMMQTLLPFYEEHHQLKIEEQAIWEAVRLSKRYIKDRRLPDAAIDLMDRTMAAIRLMDETSETVLKDLETELNEMEDKEKFPELEWFYQQLQSKVSPILLNQLEDETKVEELEEATALFLYIEKTLKTLQEKSTRKNEQVSKSDIAALVSHKTGIPLGKIQTQEREKLLQLEEALKKRVVGQDHALQSLAEAIRESRSGLLKAGQPIGSFFLMGPTGTGKTELAKSVAEFLFNDESTLLRFDMSEFKEEHSAALLYGAPPGYVGYKEGGLLVNKIRQNPYSVVLFDEIEKAHPSVFDVFLQILDEGKIHDRLGKEGDFSNAIILFTSNIGSEFVAEKFGEGIKPKTEDMMEIMSRYFRPEFLARLTEIVPFAPISEEVVERIFDIHLSKLLKLLSKQGVTLEVSPEARKHLALAGFTPKYGARPLKGVIRSKIRRPISRMIIAGTAGKGSQINLILDEEDKLDWKI